MDLEHKDFDEGLKIGEVMAVNLGRHLKRKHKRKGLKKEGLTK